METKNIILEEIIQKYEFGEIPINPNVLEIYCLFIYLVRNSKYENIKNIARDCLNYLLQKFGNPEDNEISNNIINMFILFSRGHISNYPYSKKKQNIIIKRLFQNKTYDDYIIIHCNYAITNDNNKIAERIFRISLEASLCAYGRNDLFFKIYNPQNSYYPIDYLLTRICASSDINFVKQFVELHNIIISSKNRNRLIHILEKCGTFDIAKFIIDEKKILILENQEIENILVNIILSDNIEMLRYFDKKMDINYKFIYKNEEDKEQMNKISFPSDSKGYKYFTLKNLSKAKNSLKCEMYFNEYYPNKVCL